MCLTAQSGTCTCASVRHQWIYSGEGGGRRPSVVQVAIPSTFLIPSSNRIPSSVLGRNPRPNSVQGRSWRRPTPSRTKKFRPGRNNSVLDGIYSVQDGIDSVQDGIIPSGRNNSVRGRIFRDGRKVESPPDLFWISFCQKEPFILGKFLSKRDTYSG